MEFGKVFVDSVIIGQRHRGVDKERVAALAESIKVLGLQQPISVYVDETDAAYLVAGLHRLEAARKLGWEEIDALFLRMNPIEREMWEIAENLFRVDLSKEQRDEQIRRYADLLKAREERDRAIVPQNGELPKKPGRPKSINQRIADETGLGRETVRRALNPQPKPVPPARDALNDVEIVERQVDALMRAWNAAGKEAREEFLSRIDTPVFDRTVAA